MAFHEFTGYGKNAIKEFKSSPDAWVQVAFQLAYHKLHGRQVATYEPAQARRFLHGRTACIRSATPESRDFVQAMTTKGRDPRHAAEVWELLQQALRQQSKISGEAASGQDVDRHLFGLRRLMDADTPTPSFFSHPTFALTSRWALSTSNLSVPYFANWGWGEVYPEGIGIAYSVLNDSLQFNITSRVGRGEGVPGARGPDTWATEKMASVREICDGIGEALRDMQNLHALAAAQAPPRSKM